MERRKKSARTSVRWATQCDACIDCGGTERSGSSKDAGSDAMIAGVFESIMDQRNARQFGRRKVNKAARQVEDGIVAM
jgi:hypothetical protein